MNYKIALIRGDGIGPEVVGEAVKVLEAVGQKFGHSFTYEVVQPPSSTSSQLHL